MHNLRNEFNQTEFESDELNPEYLGEFNQEFEYSNEYQAEINNQEGTFNEASQLELASELLSASHEAELDQFLGKLFKKAVGGASKFIKSRGAKALGGMLKGIAKKALPIAGRLGGASLAAFGVPPQIGARLGGSLGDAASNMFELELEGLSHEDREFETAKAFVRFAGNAARQAASVSPNQPAGAIARAATSRSARRYAPGLLKRRVPLGGNYSMLEERIRSLEDSIRDLYRKVPLAGGAADDGMGSPATTDQEYYSEY